MLGGQHHDHDKSTKKRPREVGGKHQDQSKNTMRALGLDRDPRIIARAPRLEAYLIEANKSVVMLKMKRQRWQQ